MLTIALIEADDRVVGILKSNFEKEFAAQVYTYNSCAAFFSASQTEPIELYVCRNLIGEEESAKLLLNYLYDRGNKSKVVILGEIEQSSFDFAQLPSRFRVPELNRLIISTLSLTRDQLAEMKLPDFVPIPPGHFYLMHSVPCDIFIRIERKGDADKYVKRLHAHDSFDKEAIVRYEQNGLKAFYVEKANRHQFMANLVEQSLARVDQLSDLSKSVEAMGDAFLITTDLVRQTGIDVHSAKFIDGTIGHMGRVIEANPKFTSLFSQLVKMNGELAYRHSYLIMLFGHKVIPLLDWVGKDHAEEMIQSLLYVAFFHDVFLEQDHLLSIGSKQQLLQLELSDELKDLVLNHANLAATLVQKLPHAPQGIDIIVRQHHGMANGVGFTEAYTSNISKLAIAFIVIEKFVWRIIYFNKQKENLASIFEQLSSEFSQPSYRHVVDKLRQVILS